MKDKKQLTKEMQDGERARQLLNDPMIVKALEEMRETVYHNIRTSHYSKMEEREDLYKMLRAIDAFEKQFKQKIDAGKKARSIYDRIMGN